MWGRVCRSCRHKDGLETAAKILAAVFVFRKANGGRKPFVMPLAFLRVVSRFREMTRTPACATCVLFKYGCGWTLDCGCGSMVATHPFAKKRVRHPEKLNSCLK